ncbi:MAG: hypothetical protein BGN86_14495 [Caulobacterales bacterium 68-7]|nr:MAG: hypothetical protein BGN86_14495 [Caulobacterales bacterium 68-7]
MPVPVWLVPTIVSTMGVAIVVVVNLLLIGRWVGSITAAQASLASLVSDLKRRLDDFEQEVETEASHRAAFAARMENAEKAAAALWSVRDQLTAMRAAGEVEDRYTKQKLDKLDRDVSGINQALASLTNVASRAARAARGCEG